MSEKVVPDGWKERKLGRLFDIKIGGTPSRNNPLYWDVKKESENRWVSIRDLNGRFVRDSNIMGVSMREFIHYAQVFQENCVPMICTLLITTYRYETIYDILLLRYN